MPIKSSPAPLAISEISTEFGVSNSITVTVVNPGSGNVFALNQGSGVENAPTLTLQRNDTYVFDVSDSSVDGHPLGFRTSDDTAYTTGVTVSGTAGTANAKVTLVVASDAPKTLKYYCQTHGNGMGNTITIDPDGMSEYYKGGDNVDDVATNSGIPASGAIDIGDFYGAGNAIAVAASASTNLDVAPLFPGSFTNATAKILTIAAPIQIAGNNVALTVPANMAGTLDIQNAGNIIGSRGNGGNAGSAGAGGGNGGAGGTAISILSNGVTITNSGTINGGGGGGAGGAGGAPSTNTVSGSFAAQGGGGWNINFNNISNPFVNASGTTPVGTLNWGPLSGGNAVTRIPGNGGYIDRGPRVNNQGVGPKTHNRAGGNFSVQATTPGQAGGGGGNGYGFDGSSIVSPVAGENSPGNGGAGGAGGGAGSAGAAGGNSPAANAGSVGAAGNSISSPGSVNYTVSNSGTINGTQG